MEEWAPAFADAVGAQPPRRVPVWLAKLVAGKATVGMATTLRGASNAKAKRELGWAPRYSSWRQGFREGLGERRSQDRKSSCRERVEMWVVGVAVEKKNKGYG